MTAAPAWLTEALGQLDRDDLVRPRREVELLPGGRCRIGSRTLLNFASNDYLDLARDPRLMAAAAAAAAGAGASPLVVGRSPEYRRLEEAVARFEGSEGVLLFPTGFAANLGTVAALVGREDSVFSDLDNHASLIDGCRQSRAEVAVYDRDRLEQLEQQLADSPAGGRRLIVTDGVFSMDGTMPPLADLCDLAEQFDAMLLVDEAHGTGVLGEDGRGACQAQGVEHRVTIRVGTLSKAVGASGGFVVADSPWTDYLWHQARTQVFSTGLSPASCAAAAEGLLIIGEEPWRRQRLGQAGAWLRERLVSLGLPQPVGSGPIVPVELGSPAAVLAAAGRLFEAGLLVAAIRPPTVPVGTSRLRISLTAGHSDEDLERLADAVAEVALRTAASRD